MDTKTYDISVIIPFKDKSKMTLAAVRSLMEYGPKVREIILVSNNSNGEELDEIRKKINLHAFIKVVEYNYPFNYQKINNWAVKHSKGKYILFLNNDVELVPESKNLIEHMTDLASNISVGTVGCVLLYGDKRTIQHAGVYLRPGSLGDHIYIGKIYNDVLKNYASSKYPYRILKDRKVTAVTGAVQLIERAKFDSVEGFNEDFIIGGGDVDLCLRLNKNGYQSWITGKGFILHKESQSRSHLPIPYTDFYHSYKSYIDSFNLELGDPFSPKITKVSGE